MIEEQCDAEPPAGDHSGAEPESQDDYVESDVDNEVQNETESKNEEAGELEDQEHA